jgi:hypothetical protein
MELDVDYVPTANPDVLVSEEDNGWAVLVNLDTGNSFALNPTGVFIWNMADGKKTVGDIIREIRGTFSGVPQGIEGDVCGLAARLKDRGFFGREIKLSN